MIRSAHADSAPQESSARRSGHSVVDLTAAVWRNRAVLGGVADLLAAGVFRTFTFLNRSADPWPGACRPPNRFSLQGAKQSPAGLRSLRCGQEPSAALRSRLLSRSRTWRGSDQGPGHFLRQKAAASVLSTEVTRV